MFPTPVLRIITYRLADVLTKFGTKVASSLTWVGYFVFLISEPRYVFVSKII